MTESIQNSCTWTKKIFMTLCKAMVKFMVLQSSTTFSNCSKVYISLFHSHWIQRKCMGVECYNWCSLFLTFSVESDGSSQHLCWSYTTNSYSVPFQQPLSCTPCISWLEERSQCTNLCTGLQSYAGEVWYVMGATTNDRERQRAIQLISSTLESLFECVNMSLNLFLSN